MAFRSLTFLVLPISTFALSITQRDLSPETNLPAGFQYSGCYVDKISSRSLNSDFSRSDANTGSSCIAYCSSKGYPVAGTEYGVECFCGTSVPSQIADGCNMACSGDSTQACGGPDRLSVYTSSGGPAVNPGSSGYHSLGCYTDSVQARTLSDMGHIPSESLTVESCISACKGMNFRYAGVEYAGECFCGNEISNGGVPASDGCTMPCKGDRTEYCGGPNRLNLYEADQSTTTISTSTATTTSTLTTITTTAEPTTTMTTTTTTTAAPTPSCSAGLRCSAGGYRYIYHCGEVITSGDYPTTPVPVANDDACLAVCDSDPACTSWSFTYETLTCSTYGGDTDRVTTRPNPQGIWAEYVQGACPLQG